MSVVPRLWVSVNSVAVYGFAGVIVVAYLRTTTAVSIATSSAFTVIPVPAPTANVVPVSVRPAPPAYVPAPENCVNVSAVVPSVIASSVVRTQPVFPLAVPSDTKVNRPAVTSALRFASSARAGAPEEATT